MNKIKYDLKNAYYAIATIDDTNAATYSTPVKIPGSVSLSMEPKGDANPFYADGITYYTSTLNNGYSGDFEIALVPESFKKDVLGYIEDSSKVLVEDANAATVHFAFLFQFEGDEKAIRHVLYNCTTARSKVEGDTKGEKIEPKTEKLTLTSTSVYNASLGTDIVKSETGSTTTTSDYESWFTAVHIPAKVTV